MKLGDDKEKRYETDDGSVILYRELNAEIEAEVQNRIAKVGSRGKMDYKVGDLILKILQAGIVGWENVQDSDGNEVVFNKELIKFIPKPVRETLFNLISPKGLEPDEEKNL